MNQAKIRQEQIDYDRIAKAIEFIRDNFKHQPSLEAVAAEVNLSPFHFQRLFTEWAGVSPKKFIHYLSLNYAKNLLREEQSTLLDATHEIGLSSSSRLHDLFINIESMTPGEFKHGGKSLDIKYCFAESPFGQIIIASTSRGVCHISFQDDSKQALIELKKIFPKASYHQVSDKFQKNVLLVFQKDWTYLNEIKLHLFSTPFQLKVWESLLKISQGKLTTYGNIAEKIGKPKAARAVGTAIGSNPVAFLIPCHRVIQSTGNIGDYRWGTTRKSAMIAWEASRAEK